MLSRPKHQAQTSPIQNVLETAAHGGVTALTRSLVHMCAVPHQRGTSGAAALSTSSVRGRVVDPGTGTHLLLPWSLAWLLLAVPCQPVPVPVSSSLAQELFALLSGPASA